MSFAIKMLTGDRVKYLGMVVGVTFACFLMAQQVSIFVSLMLRTASQIREVTEADLWIMDPQVIYSEEIKPLPDRDLLRVRGVTGVDWAVPLFKGFAVLRSPQADKLQQAILIGVDDSSLVGQTRSMVKGKWEDLRQPESFIMDWAGFGYTWPGQKMEVGRVVEMNDRRMKLVGICDNYPPFLTFPVVYMRYSEAIKVSPTERNKMSFILAKAKAGTDPKKLAAKIRSETGLQALTSGEFQWRNIHFYLTHTGIPVNFGITVALGFLIGAIVVGQTFYMFVNENLRYFATLKSIGYTNRQILYIIAQQSALITFLGYCLGIGLSSLFFTATNQVPAMRGFDLPWQVALGTGAVIVLIVIAASLASVQRLMKVDPAIVFRG